MNFKITVEETTEHEREVFSPDRWRSLFKATLAGNYLYRDGLTGYGDSELDAMHTLGRMIAREGKEPEPFF